MSFKDLIIIASILFTLTLSFFSCSTKLPVNSSSEINYSHLFSSFSPEFKVYHTSADSSELHLKINSSELLFTRSNSNENFKSGLKITGSIKDKAGFIVDSITTGFFNQAEVPLDQVLYATVKFKLPENNFYSLEIEYEDINKKIFGKQTVTIDKVNKFSPENFLVFSAESSFPNFSTHCRTSQLIKIESARVDLNELTVSTKDAELTLPPPPYSQNKTKLPEPSEFNKISVSKSSNKIELVELNATDVYLHDSENGILFLIRPNGFPEVSTPTELVLPLRYISAKREFEKMSENKNIKRSIDEFWLECGSNKDRAKTLISSYYQRVSEANSSFSSYKSGWRTDRGLIHIIYGRPNEIIKNSDSEIWVYGDQNTLGSVEFQFNKIDNPYSTNHFILERNPLYKSEWSRRVNAWRNGRIYD